MGKEALWSVCFHNTKSFITKDQWKIYWWIRRTKISISQLQLQLKERRDINTKTDNVTSDLCVCAFTETLFSFTLWYLSLSKVCYLSSPLLMRRALVLCFIWVYRWPNEQECVSLLECSALSALLSHFYAVFIFSDRCHKTMMSYFCQICTFCISTVEHKMRNSEDSAGCSFPCNQVNGDWNTQM